MDSSEPSDVRWRKSSYSANNGTCVEVATLLDGRVAIRNSNYPHDGTLVLRPDAMTGLLEAIKAGELQ